MPSDEATDHALWNGWLMKAEPDTRMVKGKDVAFSADHFEKMGTSHWDGVRNPLAKKYMKEGMKLGDRVLFYHSNTKVPGVAALAEVTKEGYPDHTAWDSEHPYFDAKSDKDNPKWYMVDVTFRQRVEHFVPLSLYKHLSEQKSVPEAIDYLSTEHLEAIKAMPLINRGRLSVQPVSKLAYEATVLLGEKGGFEGLLPQSKSSKAKRKKSPMENGADVEAFNRESDQQDQEDGKAEPTRRSGRKRTKT